MNHSKWNDTLRALTSSQLQLPVLKLTCLANYGRGPFKSGRWGYTLVKAAEMLIAHAGEDFLAEVSESMAFDMGKAPEEFGTITAEDFLQMPGIRTRVPEVPCLNCYDR